jgi:hypothetical protein
MKCIVTTNNPATLNFAEAVLKEAGIDYFVLDQNMNVLEPGIMIPRRLMVIDEDESAARRQLGLAGMEKDLMAV